MREGLRFAVYSLGREGARLIAEEDQLPFESLRWHYAKNHEAKDRYLKHTLEIARFRTALTLAIQHGKEPLKLERWISGFDLAKESVRVNGKRIPVYPDGFFTLRNSETTKRRHFMLEMDLGTMTIGRFAKKIQGYRTYWEEGRHKGHYRIGTFQLLTVTTREERLRNLMQATYKLYPGKRQFLFTTLDRYSLQEPEHVLNTPIFEIPGDKQYHYLLDFGE